jgi:prepilin-type N-terminal cleavage/methylation domain-containing protein
VYFFVGNILLVIYFHYMKHNQNSIRGFTLIEILVVIAIIGVLATIVIGGISNARTKAADSVIKSSLDSIVLSAQNYYDDNGENYGNNIWVTKNDCPELNGARDNMMDDPSIRSALESAMKQANGRDPVTGIRENTRCYVDTNKGWVFSVPLKSDPLKAYCIDSVGSRSIVATDPDNTTSSQTTPSECGPSVE